MGQHLASIDSENLLLSVISIFPTIESAQGFQSSESYIKHWNERRPRPDENATKGASSQSKNPRKPRKAKTICKPSHETQSEKASNVLSMLNISLQTETLSSNPNKLIEVEEISDGDEILEINHENTYSDYTEDRSDDRDALEISENAYAFQNCDSNDGVSDVYDNEDVYDNAKEIEILNDDETLDRIDVPNVPDNGDYCDDQNGTKSEITHVTEKETNNSEGNCSDLFADDSVIDDELFNLDF